MASISSKSIVAADQTDVDAQINRLLSDWNIDSTNISQLSIVPFGAVRFLITFLFFGNTFLQVPLLGLEAIKAIVKTFNRLIIVKEGLKPTIATLMRIYRLKSVTLGEKLGLIHIISYQRSFTSNLGITLVVIPPLNFPESDALSGMTAIRERLFTMGREVTSSVGFIADIGYIKEQS